ncbi:MAG: serine hydrolase domain-containing protein [Planctomycetota bacterium]
MRSRKARLGIAACTAALAAALTTPASAEPRDIHEELEAIRRGYDIPSLAAAVSRNGELLAAGAAGHYSMEHAIHVDTESKYHLGSCSKAMTAVVVASMVEEGLIDWDMTLPEALPELVDFINPALHGSTIRDLAAHRSGIAETRDGDLRMIPWTQLATIADQPISVQRAELAKTALSVMPSADPGEEFWYSNFGYILLGLIAEANAGQSFEDLLAERVFEPLEMTSAGFGPPGTPVADGDADPDEPVGHIYRDEWLPQRVIEGRPAPDNPVVFNSAGRVHASITDWARFVDDLQRGLNGEGVLLDAETYALLFEDPENDGYTLGWAVGEADWAGGTIYNHAGSNRLWFAQASIAPERNLSLVVATNAASADAQKALDEAIAQLVDMYTFTPEMLEAISSPADEK